MRVTTGLHAASPTPEAVEAFLLSRQVMGCTEATLGYYRETLHRFSRNLRTLDACDTPAVQGYLTRLRGDGLAAVSVHKHFRALRCFFGWATEAEVLPQNPMRGLTMKAPKTLPRVPEDATVRGLFAACDPETFEGKRNRALIAVLADSELRIGEALRLRVEDVNLAARTLNVRAGKGQKDSVGFFGAETAQHVRAWLNRRRDAKPEDYLFCDQQGRSLTRHAAAKILHRLSVRAGLPRKVGPHALRHYAATSILKQTGDLELVRQVLRHESLAMALRYAHLTKPDVSAKFRRASPLDNLRAGR
ncbi:MAG: tyrosine-type recombinase/integrase [Armatimonadota bacterium]|nr:tyrosine-type recombinase/integrase [Armatimonadota bacterium]